MNKKTKELKAMSEKDRANKLVEIKKELMKERAQAAGGPSKSAGKIRSLKRTIARIHTLANQKEERNQA